jgi:hypothetical protein
MSAMLLVIQHVAVPAYALYHSPLGRPEPSLWACRGGGNTVVCYPRDCDSLGFYLRRDDVRSYRSTATASLVEFLVAHPGTVILFSHRHSLEALRPSLPASMKLTGVRTLGAGDSWYERSFSTLRRLVGETRQELYHVAVATKVDAPERALVLSAGAASSLGR